MMGIRSKKNLAVFYILLGLMVQEFGRNNFKIIRGLDAIANRRVNLDEMIKI